MLLPLVTILIYGAGVGFPGWSFHEALLIQAVFMLCTGVCSPLFYNVVWLTMNHVKEGTYDLMLIKPGSVVFNTLAYSFEAESIGILAGGLFIFFYALSNLPLPSVMDWVKFIFLFTLGIIMSLGLVLLMASSSFVWVGNSRIFEIYDALTALGRYPGSIYPTFAKNIVSYILPVATLGFFPASAILGESSGYMFFAAIPCTAFLAVGILLFKKMISEYQSAGG